jgi:ferredoxin
MSHYYFLPHQRIDDMLYQLQGDGYKCVAPRHHESEINYDTITKSADLPWGFHDEQAPGHYKVNKSDHKHAFGFVLPTTSVKPMLFKAKENVWKVKRNDEGKLAFEPIVEFEKIAVFGVRPCDLRGIEIQDRVFMENSYNDVRYVKRRENQFLIAMNCTKSHSNCFCVALGDAPQADKGFDLAMTEIEGDGFVVEIGSDKGRALLDALDLEAASGGQAQKALAKIVYAVDGQKKTLPPIKEVETKLMANLEHPQWDDVASRCLSCGSCTQVCPTCFCHTERDEPNVLGTETNHTREWDSCFSIDHSYTHGDTFREDPKYR